MSSVVGRDFEYVLEQGWSELNFAAAVRAREDRTGVTLQLDEDNMPQPPASGWRAQNEPRPTTEAGKPRAR